MTAKKPGVGSKQKRIKIIRDVPQTALDQYRTIPNISDIKKGKKPRTKLPPPPSNWR